MRSGWFHCSALLEISSSQSDLLWLKANLLSLMEQTCILFRLVSNLYRCGFLPSQTTRLVGPQTELCAVCHREGRPQGHVHQERCWQCVEQQQVGVNVTFKETFKIFTITADFSFWEEKKPLWWGKPLLRKNDSDSAVEPKGKKGGSKWHIWDGC